MKRGDWTFLTKQGCVLSYLAKNPRSTIREVAEQIGITERTTLKIIDDLETCGYLSRHKEGRHNLYSVRPELPMRPPVEGNLTVGDLLLALGWNPEEQANTKIRLNI